MEGVNAEQGNWNAQSPPQLTPCTPQEWRRAEKPGGGEPHGKWLTAVPPGGLDQCIDMLQLSATRCGSHCCAATHFSLLLCVYIITQKYTLANMFSLWVQTCVASALTRGKGLIIVCLCICVSIHLYMYCMRLRRVLQPLMPQFRAQQAGSFMRFFLMHCFFSYPLPDLNVFPCHVKKKPRDC